MDIFKRRTDLNFFLLQKNEAGKKIGFVPTMGALHEGHLSLVKACAVSCDVVVVSIFVNPTQFNNATDFDLYPRMPEIDIQLLNGFADVVYLPEVSDLFQENEKLLSEDLINPLNHLFEGTFRPGHYAGVITVVHKLFDATIPAEAFFGQKDYQQVLVISKMANQLHPHIKITTIETQRTESGLAMSSRNLRLSENELETASHIYAELYFIKQVWISGVKQIEKLEKAGIEKLNTLGIEVEYLSIVNASDLNKGDAQSPKVLIFAGYVGGVRLIDNIML